MNIGVILGSKNGAKFVNNNGEYCIINRYYVNNKLKYQVIFAETITSLATRNAINTTSEKRIVKLINDEGFIKI
jgi:hypothetical protein